MQGSFNGLDALRSRLRERRAREQANLDLAGPLEELRDRLDDIVDRERSTLSFRAEDDARMREAFLDALPPDVPGRVGELSDYRFVDPEAQEAFDELMDTSTRTGHGRVLPQHGGGDALDVVRGSGAVPRHAGRAEPHDRAARARRAVRLRRIHAAPRRLLPREPEDARQLLEQMAARMAAMSRLLASMSPQERAELRALAEQVLQDMDLAFEVDRLGSNLASAFPDLGGEPALAGGDEQMPLSATIDAMERLHDLEELERSAQG